MHDEKIKKNMFAVVVVIPQLSEYQSVKGGGRPVCVPAFLYLLHVLKHSGRAEAIYCFTDDKNTKNIAAEYGCRVMSVAQRVLVAADVDDLMDFCLKKLENEVAGVDHVLLVNAASAAFLRFPLDAFFSIFDSTGPELVFSAEKEDGAIWKMPVSADPGKISTDCAEPIHTIQQDGLQVRETGDVYAFSIAAWKNKKKRFLMQAKPILPCCEKEHDEKGIDSLSESMADMLNAVRELDGVVKSFILSHAAVIPKTDAPVFPNGFQKFLIFFYAPFVWMVGGKYHYDRLKKDPAAFFRVTQDAFNLFFLKILDFFGPTPRI